jgi:hypothetical protein
MLDVRDSIVLKVAQPVEAHPEDTQISSTWNFRVSRNCASFIRYAQGVKVMPSSRNATRLELEEPP